MYPRNIELRTPNSEHPMNFPLSPECLLTPALSSFEGGEGDGARTVEHLSTASHRTLGMLLACLCDRIMIHFHGEILLRGMSAETLSSRGDARQRRRGT